VVAIDSEPLKLLNSETCSTKPEDEPREPDRDLAKPFVSEALRPSDPDRDLCKEI